MMRCAKVSFIVLAIVLTSPALAGDEATTRKSAGDQNAADLYRKAFTLLPDLTDAERRLSRSPKPTPLSAVARRAIKKSGPALDMVLRAAKVKRCDWEFNKGKIIQEFMPILSEARQVARLACLRARYNLKQGRPQAAADDLTASLTLSRHIGADAPLICYMVQVVIESLVVETIAENLTGFDAAGLKVLAERLDSVPAGGSLKTTLEAEKEFVAAQTSYNPLAGPTMQMHDELIPHADLPPDEFAKKFKAIKSTAGNPVAPAIEKASHTQARARARMAMLKAAIAVQLKGPDALKSIKDPYGDGPFRYRATKKGFELRSKLRVDGKPVTLTVGPEDPPRRPRGRR